MKLKERLILVLFIVIILLLAGCTTSKCDEELNWLIYNYVECTSDWWMSSIEDPNDAVELLVRCSDPLITSNRDCDCPEKRLIDNYVSCFLDVDFYKNDTPYDVAVPLLDCAIDLTKGYNILR